MLDRVLLVARTHVIELSRRRFSILLLVLMPLAFYFAAGRTSAFAPTFVTVGVGWAVAIVTLFSGLAVDSIAPRLTLVGYRSAELILGRLLAIIGFGAFVGVLLWALTMTLSDIVESGALAAAFAAAVIAGVTLGLAVASLLVREMEATLLLIAVAGLQLPISHESAPAKILPLYATERLSSRATGGVVSTNSILVWGALSAVVLLILATVGANRRYGR